MRPQNTIFILSLLFRQSSIFILIPDGYVVKLANTKIHNYVTAKLL